MLSGQRRRTEQSMSLAAKALKDLGLSRGHRLKMLQAIRDLSNISVAPTAPVRPVVTEPTRPDEVGVAS